MGRAQYRGLEIYDAESLGAQQAQEATIEKARGAPIKLPQDSHSATYAFKVVKESGSKTLEVNRFKFWLRQISSFEICTFSDGSTEEHGRSAWGFSMLKDDTTFYTDYTPLQGCEVIDTENSGANKALISH